MKDEDEISEINIKIFKEDTAKIIESYSIIPTELLLRVEWSNEEFKDNATHIHAQPHWHIHSYKQPHSNKFVDFIPIEHQKTILELLDMEANNGNFSIMENSVTTSEEDKMRNSVSIDSKKEILHFKFHLAMLAEWDKIKESKHNKILTDDILKIWLPKCLLYIKDQLEYILERIGGNINKAS
jgi:hypothetical protein